MLQVVAGTSTRATESTEGRAAALPRARGARPLDPALQPPPFRNGLVRRPRLVHRLIGEREVAVVLIKAPAGYGKTSLLSEWATREERPFGWVTLDDGDNDPARLLRSIAAALEAVGALDGGACRQLIGDQTPKRALALASKADGVPPNLLRSARTLWAAAGAGGEPPVLVLDDVHLLRSEESSCLLGALASATPAGGLLVLGSRTAPALPLGRLRAANALLAFDVHDLALTSDEAQRLLAAAGLRLDLTDVERLRSRTEGWPAGLYLAALALREQPADPGALDRLRGDEQPIAEYVNQEVLGQVSPEVLAFLTGTSVLEQLSAGVCDALLERRGSGALLRRIAAGNPMVMAVNQSHSTYRCHGLVRDVLRAELERLEPGQAEALHRRASRWFAEHGDIDQAASHAAAAGDAGLTGELVWAHAPRYLMQGREATVQRWLGAFSQDQIAASAPLALCAAHTHLTTGDLRLAEHWARTVAGTHQRGSGDAGASLAGGVAIIEAAAGRLGVERMAEQAGWAYELVEDASPWRALCCLLRGVAQHLGGDRGAARQHLEEGARRATAGAPHVESLCLSQLALLAADAGDWERACDLVASAGGILDRAGLAEHPLSAFALAVSAWVRAHQGPADEGKRDLRKALHLLAPLSDFIPWYEAQARVLLARAATRLADAQLARMLLSEASRLVRRVPDAALLRVWLDEVWADLDELGAQALTGRCALTMAELRILRFLPSHLSFREIGSRLHVSTNTVKSQAHAVYGKLEASSRSEAVARATRLGLIDAGVT